MSGTSMNGATFRPFDKYDLHGDYHWQEWYSNTTYSDYVCGLKTWVTGGKILDVGAGDGLISHVLGIKDSVDSSDTAIDLAAQHGVHVKHGDACDLPYGSGVFDSVFMGDTIEHIHHDLLALRQCWRVLKPGGLLFLTTPPSNESDEPGEYDVRRYSVVGICHLIRSTGFQIVGTPFVAHQRIHVRARKAGARADEIEFLPYTSIHGAYDKPSPSVVSLIDGGPRPYPDDMAPPIRNRRDKMRPDVLFPSVRWHLYADGGARWKRDPEELFHWARGQNPEAQLYLFAHGERNCPYAEADEIERLNLDYPDKVKRAREICRESGIEPESGLYSGGLVIRSNCANGRDFGRIWWELYRTNGLRRDQVILPVALKRSGIRFHVLPTSAMKDFVEFVPHVGTREVTSEN